MSSESDRVWFTSDTHFNHNNVIKFSDRREFMSDEELDYVSAVHEVLMRPESSVVRNSLIAEWNKFKISDESVERMNEHLIEEWNGHVGNGDRVYFLGDFAYGKPHEIIPIFDRLNGQIFLIKGNHDSHTENAFKRLGIPKNVVWKDGLRDLESVTIDGVNIQMSHYAMRTWNRASYGAIHVYGHSHGSLPERGRSMDVGVDTKSNYGPWSAREVIERLTAREFHYDDKDHHSDREFNIPNSWSVKVKMGDT